MEQYVEGKMYIEKNSCIGNENEIFAFLQKYSLEKYKDTKKFYELSCGYGLGSSYEAEEMLEKFSNNFSKVMWIFEGEQKGTYSDQYEEIFDVEGFLTIFEAQDKWGVSEEYIKKCILEGEIEFYYDCAIPEDTQKPEGNCLSYAKTDIKLNAKKEDVMKVIRIINDSNSSCGKNILCKLVINGIEFSREEIESEVYLSNFTNEIMNVSLVISGPYDNLVSNSNCLMKKIAESIPHCTLFSKHILEKSNTSEGAVSKIDDGMLHFIEWKKDSNIEAEYQDYIDYLQDILPYNVLLDILELDDDEDNRSVYEDFFENSLEDEIGGCYLEDIIADFWLDDEDLEKEALDYIYALNVMDYETFTEQYGREKKPHSVYDSVNKKYLDKMSEILYEDEYDEDEYDDED